MVSGTRTGSKALVQRNAIAKEEPPLVTALAIQERSSGLASALRSFSAQHCFMICLLISLTSLGAYEVPRQP